jgi:hypothetical protein
MGHCGNMDHGNQECRWAPSSEVAEGAGDIALDWRGCCGIEPGSGEANPLDGEKRLAFRQ